MIDAASASVVLDKSQNFSYRLGSMGPVTKEIHSLAFEMCWPRELPSNLLHAGIAFGQQDDTPYRVSGAKQRRGLSPDHSAGTGSWSCTGATQEIPPARGLQSIMTSPVSAGEWMRLQNRRHAASIRFSRLDGAGWSGVTMDREYRGGYISLCKDYPDPGPGPVQGMSVT